MEGKRNVNKHSHIKFLMESQQLIPFPSEDEFGFVHFDSQMLSSEFKEKARLLEQNATQQNQAGSEYEKVKQKRKTREDYLLEFEEIPKEEMEDEEEVMRGMKGLGGKGMLTNEQWFVLLETKNFGFRSDPTLHAQVKRSVYAGLDKVSPMARQNAWMLMLHIDQESEEYKSHEELYLLLSNETSKEDMTKSQLPAESQIVKDVFRTFASTGLFNQDPMSGKNRLYNLLKVYSIINSDTHYVQGMNFIAALILMAVPSDEVCAFVIFSKLMLLDEWKKLYLPDTPKLFVLADRLGQYVKQVSPRLYKSLDKSDIFLESLFASPFMTLFSNLIREEEATKVLDRFMLEGERAVLDIMKLMIRTKLKDLEKMESWDLQVFLGRKMYEVCLREGSFFPKVEGI